MSASRNLIEEIDELKLKLSAAERRAATAEEEASEILKRASGCGDSLREIELKLLRSEQAAATAYADALRDAAALLTKGHQVICRCEVCRWAAQILRLAPTSAHLRSEIRLIETRLEECRWWSSRYDVSPYNRQQELESQLALKSAELKKSEGEHGD